MAPVDYEDFPKANAKLQFEASFADAGVPAVAGAAASAPALVADAGAVNEPVYA